ncbi:UvrD-helicase domain-containing protein [Clostridium estertheticum]|uniref:UvrD-helicase domain-containing protein n=1 Tax=Clostridium estertheticum TaxID=238834 RepID=UPI001C0E673E|nr:ATP-dependent helicase [Clostridium estertheticum]MBU3183245.1 ATP-dependent helicase [Clostridium estertheticum]
MSVIIQEEFWQPVDGMVLEENAIASVREVDNVLVVAGPGAGKTELLAQKACYLLQTNKCPAPKKILAISFKNDAADNLQKRVEKRCGKELSRRFVSKTYDAFAKGIFDRFRNGLPEEYLPDSDYGIVQKNDPNIKQAFKQCGYIGNTDMIMNKILGALELPFNSSNNYESVWKLVIKGNCLDVEPTVNFQMISRLAEYIFRINPYILKALQMTYSHVFLDEFQDTTEIQYELVKTCFKDSDINLTAVGDVKQRIMVWAGALQTVFDDYKRDFHGVEKELLMNHRSAPQLVAIQQMMYASLADTPKEIECSPKWKEDDGEVYLYKFSDYTVEAVTIAEDIVKRNNSGVELKDMCILTKQTPQIYAETIMDELKERGIMARIEADYQDLLKEPIILLLLHSIYLVTHEKCPDSWEVVNDFIFEIIQSTAINNEQVFENVQKESYKLMRSHREDLNRCEDSSIFSDVVHSILKFYDVATIKTVYPKYVQGTYFEELLDKFITIVWNEYESAESNWKLALENFQGLHSIPIMTIHKSKGLEFDTVYFVGLEDGAFWNFKKQPLEDRCAFFVALSRAKRAIVFTFSEMRNLRYPKQKNNDINEFFELLENIDYVQKIDL